MELSGHLAVAGATDASVEADSGFVVASDVLVAVIIFSVSDFISGVYIALRCSCNGPVRFYVGLGWLIAVIEVLDHGTVKDQVGVGDAVIEGFRGVSMGGCCIVSIAST